jgi:hypothetical protein
VLATRAGELQTGAKGRNGRTKKKNKYIQKRKGPHLFKGGCHWPPKAGSNSKGSGFAEPEAVYVTSPRERKGGGEDTSFQCKDDISIPSIKIRAIQERMGPVARADFDPPDSALLLRRTHLKNAL